MGGMTNKPNGEPILLPKVNGRPLLVAITQGDNGAATLTSSMPTIQTIHLLNTVLETLRIQAAMEVVNGDRRVQVVPAAPPNVRLKG